MGIYCLKDFLISQVASQRCFSLIYREVINHWEIHPCSIKVSRWPHGQLITLNYRVWDRSEGQPVSATDFQGTVMSFIIASEASKYIKKLRLGKTVVWDDI